MKTITEQAELEEHCGTLQLKSPWAFRDELIKMQPNDLNNSHTILFNKGRYFETTLPNQALRVSIAKAIKCKLQYKTMTIGSWKKLESFIKAMNKRGYYVYISLDWI